LLVLILTQTALKTGYEIMALPVTNIVVRYVKKHEQTDVYDKDITYNPIKISDI